MFKSLALGVTSVNSQDHYKTSGVFSDSIFVDITGNSFTLVTTNMVSLTVANGVDVSILQPRNYFLSINKGGTKCQII